MALQSLTMSRIKAVEMALWFVRLPPFSTCSALTHMPGITMRVYPSSTLGAPSWVARQK